MVDSSARSAVHLAVLIDADNIPVDAIDGLFAKVSSLGEASVRRLYGDFSVHKAWRSAILRHGIVPQQQFPQAAKKNSTDIALVIDAMDLLLGGKVDGFCIVSSDSDFTRLAQRVREDGKHVYGFAERSKATEGLRSACHEFFYLDDLRPAEVKPRVSHGGGPKLDILRALEGLAGAGAQSTWVPLSSLGKRLHQHGHPVKRLGAKIQESAILWGLEYDASKLRVRKGTQHR